MRPRLLFINYRLRLREKSSSLSIRKPQVEASGAAHSCNPSAWELEAGSKVQGQPLQQMIVCTLKLSQNTLLSFKLFLPGYLIKADGTVTTVHTLKTTEF